MKKSLVHHKKRGIDQVTNDDCYSKQDDTVNVDYSNIYAVSQESKITKSEVCKF